MTPNHYIMDKIIEVELSDIDKECELLTPPFESKDSLMRARVLIVTNPDIKFVQVSTMRDYPQFQENGKDIAFFGPLNTLERKYPNFAFYLKTIGLENAIELTDDFRCKNFFHISAHARIGYCDIIDKGWFHAI